MVWFVHVMLITSITITLLALGTQSIINYVYFHAPTLHHLLRTLLLSKTPDIHHQSCGRMACLLRRVSPVLCISIAFFLFSTLFSEVVAQKKSPTITFAPSEDELQTAENAEEAAWNREYQEERRLGKKPAYIITLRGENFGTDSSKIFAWINAMQVEDVLLHNDTTISIRVPENLVLDRKSLRSSLLEVRVGDEKRFKLPLHPLRSSITKVDLSNFRKEISSARERRFRETESEDANFREEEHNEELTQGSKNSDSHVGYENAGKKKAREEVESSKLDAEQEDDDSRTKNEQDAQLHGIVSEAEVLLLEGNRQDVKRGVKMLENAIAEENPRAMTILGSALLSGSAAGLHRDVEAAVKHLHGASDRGYPDAQAVLGFLYASGIAGTSLRKDIGAAILMWTFAAEGGSMFAKMALGFRYYTGSDVPENCQQALKYYKEVADEVFMEARRAQDLQAGRKEETANSDGDFSVVDIRPPSFSTMHSSHHEYLTEGMNQRFMGEANEIVQFYHHSADRGDPRAQVIMGNLYYYGALDMPQNLNRARQLFTKAANGGNAAAHAHIGFMDLKAGRNESAFYHMKKAADQGDKLGLHGMGYLILHGIGGEKNERQAASYFTQAADKNFPEAKFNLGVMYLREIGVTHSVQKAFQLFRDAAQYGHIQSHYQLGIMYLKGDHPAKKDCRIATHHLKYVAQKGKWNKILFTALKAYEESAYADALFRYLQAAHAGIQSAQFNAAFMYEHNTLKNINGMSSKLLGLKGSSSWDMDADRNAVVEEALELYQMSASQGHANSMVRIGDLAFMEGKDFARAASAYERAVKSDSAEAMFNLGWMHARGFGMNSDKHLAKRYFDLAKERDVDAGIPASIALFALKYSDTVFAWIDRLLDFFNGINWMPNKSKEDPEVSVTVSSVPLENIDVVILSCLLGILIPVLVARQMRLISRNRARDRRHDDERLRRELGTGGNSTQEVAQQRIEREREGAERVHED